MKCSTPRIASQPLSRNFAAESEQHYFEEYYATYHDLPTENLNSLSSQKILALWTEFEQHAERHNRLGLLQKLSILFRFNLNALRLFLRSPELVIPYLQHQFYSAKAGA